MPKRSDYKRHTVTMPPVLSERLVQVAKETNSTVSEIVTAAVSMYLNEHHPHDTFMGIFRLHKESKKT